MFSELEKIRNFSYIFTRKEINNLIKKDYSYLDELKRVFNLNETTYYLSIKNIYKTLKKEYRNEYVYKNELIKNIIRNYKKEETIIINEFKINNSKVDIAMFNGISRAYEIKTELDTDKRLIKQLKDYNLLFNECYIITYENMINKYKNMIPKEVGIISLSYDKGKIRFTKQKEAIINNNINSDVLMESLRTYEYKSIIKKHFRDNTPIMDSSNMYDICRELMKNIEDDKLNEYFIECMKNRKKYDDKFLLRDVEDEFKQVFLSLNMSEKTYNEFIINLN